MHTLPRFLLALFAMHLGAMTCLGQGTPLDPRDATLPKVTLPDEFALVFSFGYVTDWMPKDPAKFEAMLKNMQRTGINTVHCKYTDWRLKLCEQYGVKMMIDLAVPEHDLKQGKCAVEEAEDIKNLNGAEEKFAAAKADLDKVNARLKAIGAELKPAKGQQAPDAARVAELQKEKQDLEAQRPALEKRKAVLIASNVKYICGKVRGSKGVWGAVPMPPNPQVKDDDAKKIIAWVLSLK